MPKMKTRKSAVKRLKLTGRGKLLRKSPGAGHLQSRKTPKRLRNFRKSKQVHGAFAKALKVLLGPKA